jgi:hypothetical protein
LGGGFGRSVSVELGLNVNRSTSENTLVCRVALGVVALAPAAVAPDDDDDEDDDNFSFSFPRLVADENARKKPFGSFDGTAAKDEARDDGPATLDPPTPRRELGKFTLAGWNVARDL